MAASAPPAPTGVAVPPVPGTPPAQDAPPAPSADDEKPKDIRALYDKLARKDKNLLDVTQRVRALEPAALLKQQFDAEMQTNPVAALHKYYGLTLSDLSKRALDLGELPGQTPAAVDPAKEPPEVKALRLRLEQLEANNVELQKQQQTVQAAQARQREVSTIATHLGTRASDFALVNELGKAEDVYGHVLEHLKTRGQFESEEEATEVVEFFARQVESQLRAELQAMTSKPGVRSWLQGQLQTQSEAMPTRQETRVPTGVRNPAPPPVSNSLSAQRSALETPADFASLPYDEQLRRTAALMRGA